jgi:excisionase family DNA binding protein
MKRPSPKPSPSASEMMTVPQVAEYLHYHPPTLYRLLYLRKILGFRLGADWRFRRADIEAWIAEPEVKVAPEKGNSAEMKRAGQTAAMANRIRG